MSVHNKRSYFPIKWRMSEINFFGGLIHSRFNMSTQGFSLVSVIKKKQKIKNKNKKTPRNTSNNNERCIK